MATSFDLNAAVQDWRHQLAQQPALQVPDLDELETHLRDALDDLRRRGLSDEEAFLIGRRRLGPAESVGGEFAKAHPARVAAERGLWMMGGTIGLSLISAVAGMAGSAAVSVAWVFGRIGAGTGWESPQVLGAIYVTIQTLVLAGLLGLGWRWLQRPPGRWRDRLVALRARPWAAGVTATLLAVISAGLMLTVSPVAWRLVDPSIMGVVAVWQSIGHLALGLLVWPVALTFLAMQRARVDQGATVG